VLCDSPTTPSGDASECIATASLRRGRREKTVQNIKADPRKRIQGHIDRIQAAIDCEAEKTNPCERSISNARKQIQQLEERLKILAAG